MLKKISIMLPLLLSALLLAACVSHEAGWSLPLQHPADAGLSKRPPVCTDCHDASNENFNWQRFNHDTYFGENHRQQAYQNSRVCSMCHRAELLQRLPRHLCRAEALGQEPDGHLPALPASR